TEACVGSFSILTFSRDHLVDVLPDHFLDKSSYWADIDLPRHPNFARRVALGREISPSIAESIGYTAHSYSPSGSAPPRQGEGRCWCEDGWQGDIRACHSVQFLLSASGMESR